MDLTEADRAPPPGALRRPPRDPRRLALIEAAIAVLAARGDARITLAEVALAARLPHALVNVQVKTKEHLLAETLGWLVEEHRQNWLAALEAAPADPVSQLDAMLAADFAPALYTPARIGAWAVFRGSAQCRPLVEADCAAADADHAARLEALCAAMIAAGGYAADPVRVARVLRLTVGGLWRDPAGTGAPWPRPEALATVYAAAAAFFPHHFGPDGPIAGGLAVRPAG